MELELLQRVEHIALIGVAGLTLLLRAALGPPNTAAFAASSVARVPIPLQLFFIFLQLRIMHYELRINNKTAGAFIAPFFYK